MPSDQEHLDKINKNKQVSTYLQNCSFDSDEWIVVMAFYMVVHIVEKYYASHYRSGSIRRHSENHGMRRNTLFRLIDRGIIHDSSLKHKYRLLYNASILARYESISDFNTLYKTRILHILNLVDEFDRKLS